MLGCDILRDRSPAYCSSRRRLRLPITRGGTVKAILGVSGVRKSHSPVASLRLLTISMPRQLHAHTKRYGRSRPLSSTSVKEPAPSLTRNASRPSGGCLGRGAGRAIDASGSGRANRSKIWVTRKKSNAGHQFHVELELKKPIARLVAY